MLIKRAIITEKIDAQLSGEDEKAAFRVTNLGDDHHGRKQRPAFGALSARYVIQDAQEFP